MPHKLGAFPLTHSCLGRSIGLASVTLFIFGCATPPSAPPPPPSADFPTDGTVPIMDISKVDQIPIPTIRGNPTYPKELREKGIEGQVVVDFIVDTTGRVRNAHVATATDARFGPSAVAAVAGWPFRPGRKDGQAVNVHVQVPISFKLDHVGFRRRPQLPPEAGTDLAAGDNRVPTLDISKVDQIPIPVVRVNPSYPLEFRRAGVGGQALIDFIVDENGLARNVFVKKATADALGEAAAASVCQWTFKPGIKDGKVVRTHLQVPIVFTLNNDE